MFLYLGVVKIQEGILGCVMAEDPELLSRQGAYDRTSHPCQQQSKIASKNEDK